MSFSTLHHITFFTTVFFFTFLISISKAQDRAPHGLVYENPIALSPQAYDFFHPANQMTKSNPLVDDAGKKYSPLPLAATVQSDVAHESRSPPEADHKSKIGAGAITGIVFGVAVAVFLAMGVFYVTVTRRSNLDKTKSTCPEA